jgi:hypothetical protein
MNAGGEAPPRLLYMKFIITLAAIFLSGLFWLGAAFNPDGPAIGNLAPMLFIVAVLLVACLVAGDHQQRVGRRVAAAAFNVGIALAGGELPVMVLGWFGDPRHRSDVILATVTIPTTGATAAAVITGLKALVRSILEALRPNASA